jgi:hypothetical protein
MPRCEEVVGEEDMSAIENLTEARSDKSVPFRITVRFRAPNGALVSVAVDLPVAADEAGRRRTS